MNEICQKQNSQHQLDRLASQRQLYSEAKTIQNISIVLTIPIPLVWIIVAAIFPYVQEYAALWGVCATFIDFPILNRLQKSRQEKAAAIQQLFDCDILGLDWSNLICENRPEPELIKNYSESFKKIKPDYSELQNWYPVVVCDLPLEEARIICQRTNVWWDAQLRRRYANLLLSALITMLVVITLSGLFHGSTLKELLLAILVPLLPTFSFGLRQYFEHMEAANRLDRLREKAETAIQNVEDDKIAPQELQREAYSLQNQIYDNRRRSPVVPDQLYSLLKRQDEEAMNVGAEVLVQRLLDRKRP